MRAEHPATGDENDMRAKTYRDGRWVHYYPSMKRAGRKARIKQISHGIDRARAKARIRRGED